MRAVPAVVTVSKRVVVVVAAVVVAVIVKQRSDCDKQTEARRLPFPLPFFKPRPPATPSSASSPPGPKLFDLDFLTAFGAGMEVAAAAAAAAVGLLFASVVVDAELVGMTAMLLRERRGRGWGSLDDIVGLAEG